MGKNSRILGLLLAAALPALAPAKASAKTDGKKPPAAFSVSGLGWWGDREQRITLERLLGDERGPVAGANVVEDAVFLLVSGLQEQGFLRPEVRARLTLADGRKVVYRFDASLTTLLPPDLQAVAVSLRVRRGVRSVIAGVRFEGLAAIPEKAARGYFLPTDIPLVGAAARACSPARLRGSEDSLLAALQARGYAEATVRARVVRDDPKTGDVDVAVDVKEGPRWVISSVETPGVATTGVALSPGHWAGQPWSMRSRQDIAEEIRKAFYRAGYPDVRIQVDGQAEPPGEGRRAVKVVATVTPGEAVRVGAVRFEGNLRTRDATLRSRVKVAPGDPLDPLQLERTRLRLARLGVFSSVDLGYDPAAGGVRDPVFTFHELPRRDASLLLGYGSYEQLRGGVELRQTNLFGTAQQGRLRFVQSMKSTSGEYTHTVPGILGDDVDGTARLFGLRRAETSFLREEYGGTVALKRRLPWIGASGSLGYTYQYLRNADNELFTSASDHSLVRSASVSVGLAGDHRDNPLRPRSGYRWFAQMDWASRALGGEVDDQVFELGVADHIPWGGGRWLHLGLTHGFITTWGAPAGQSIPVNTRFYPGGDSSIRGYRSGEASPRGPDGRFIGAETYTLLNVELEQAITSSWSLVFFGDALGDGASLGEPFDERLYSVGLGVRYQTIIGPLRLEYGHNLNPRPGDPDGTLHFSVGFPF